MGKAEMFCVIGKTCGKFNNTYPRKFYRSEKKAVEHAKNILERYPSSDQLCYVVEVVCVVEIAKVPVSARALTPDDLSAMEAE